MKIVKYTLLSLIALIIIAAVAGWLYLEPLVKGAVHKFGSQIVGTEVNLAGFKFNPLAGEIEIQGLTVANPKGYSAPHLLSLGTIAIKVDPQSLTSDTIMVENITVLKPEITYEMPDFTTSNVMQIQENVARNTAKAENAESAKEAKATEAEAAEPTAAAKPAKNVVIKKVLVEGGALSAITPLQKNNQALTLQMPAVELTGIGENHQRMTISESITTIFNKILFNATSVVTKALGNASEMAQKAANDAVEAAKAKANEEAQGLLDKVKFW